MKTINYYNIMKLLVFILAITLMSFSCKHQQPENKVAFDNKVEEMENMVPKLQKDTLFVFEEYKANQLPQDWSQFFTGRGDGTDWKIVNENGNKVLAQLSSDNPNYHFNGIVFDEFITKNVKLTVKMKAISGKKDQGGGFVWRYIDKDNYYVVRANPLEDNVVLYKVVDGDRSDLTVLGKNGGYGVDVERLGQNWNTLSVKVIDDLFTVYLNDKEIFQVKDQTFVNQGKVGLWTKADAVSYFDDFKIEKLK